MLADSSGIVDSNTPLESIVIPFGQSIAAQESTKINFVGNFDARLADTDTFSSTIDVYDSLGNAHPV